MNSCFKLLLMTALFCASSVHAAKIVKPKLEQKEKLVLMPLRVSADDQALLGAMETALVQGLQLKYEVFAGEQVAQKASQIFNKESQKKECDETKCFQGIAEAFQAELLATTNIIKRPDGYFLALKVLNIFDNKVVYSNSLPCKDCDAYQAVEKLKELAGTAVQVTGTPVIEPVAVVKGTDPENVTWNEAQRGNTVDDYQVYLDAYPKGKYIAFARAKIKKLREEANAAAEQQEQKAWNTAQQGGDEASIERYLQAYPAGRFAGFARSRLSKLKQEASLRAETELWEQAKNGKDRQDIEAYLTRYPKGTYLLQAGALLKQVKEEEARSNRQTPGSTHSTAKSASTAKSRLVFMPLRVPDEDRNLQGAMEAALVQGLQEKYIVFSGESVVQKARELFNRESARNTGKVADENRLMQGLAADFHAELLATANVSKQGSGYFIAVSIQDIFQNKVIDSKSATCEGCSSFKLVEKLKELGGK